MLGSMFIEDDKLFEENNKFYTRTLAFSGINFI